MHNIYATVTDRGREKLAQSLVNDTTYPIRYFVVESSNDVLKPTVSQSSLSKSAYWGSAEELSHNADGEGSVKLELPIREHEGGWWVREIGIYDIDKELFAVARGLEVYLPYLGLEAWEYPEAVLFNCYFKTADSGNVELALMHDVQPQIEHIQEIMLPKSASIEETIAGVKDNKFVTPKSLQAKKASTTDYGLTRLATNAEAQALTSDLVSLTPFALAQAFRGSNYINNANGTAIKLPNAMIIQYSSVMSNPNQWGVGVIFPTAFSNNNWALTVSTMTGTSILTTHQGKTSTGFFLQTWDPALALHTNSPTWASWIAIGF